MKKINLLRQIGLRHTANLFLLYCLKKTDLFQRAVRIRPIMASIKVTEACNSRCITCNLGQKKKDADELTLLEMTDLLQQLYNAGCRYVRFTGGEPLLFRDLSKLIQQAQILGFQRIYLATNGLLLKKRAGELDGLTHLSVSLDGLQENNDTIRGIPGDFHLSVEGIKRMQIRCHSPQVEIATTLLRKNLADVEGLIQLCADLKAKWFINLFDTNPYFFQDLDVLGLKADPPGTVRKAMGLIKQELQRRPECFVFEQRQFKTVETFLLQGAYPRHCILGFTNVDIGSKGEVYSGCWAMKPMGNIREQSLESILTNPAYTRRALRMLSRRCPQCTCGWMINTMYDDL